MRPLNGGGGVDSGNAGRAPACGRPLETVGGPQMEPVGVGLATFRAAWVHVPETPHAPKVRQTHGGHGQDSGVRGASGAPRGVAGRRRDLEPTTVARGQPPASRSTHPPHAGIGAESSSSPDRAYKTETHARS